LQKVQQQLKLGFMSKGYPENEALAKKAYKAIEYKVMVQSSVLSIWIFSCLLGALFLLCIPFIL
jgi:DHA2 family multidrug resistance protein